MRERIQASLITAMMTIFMIITPARAEEVRSSNESPVQCFRTMPTVIAEDGFYTAYLAHMHKYLTQEMASETAVEEEAPPPTKEEEPKKQLKVQTEAEKKEAEQKESQRKDGTSTVFNVEIPVRKLRTTSGTVSMIELGSRDESGRARIVLVGGEGLRDGQYVGEMKLGDSIHTSGYVSSEGGQNRLVAHQDVKLFGVSLGKGVNLSYFSGVSLRMRSTDDSVKPEQTSIQPRTGVVVGYGSQVYSVGDVRRGFEVDLFGGPDFVGGTATATGKVIVLPALFTNVRVKF